MLGGVQQTRVDAQIGGEDHFKAFVFGGIVIHFGRQIVFHVARREQHAGQADDFLGPRIAQLIQARADHRRGKFQEPAFDHMVGQAFFNAHGKLIELRNRAFIARSMAADHDGWKNIGHGWSSFMRWSLPRAFGNGAGGPGLRPQGSVPV